MPTNNKDKVSARPIMPKNNKNIIFPSVLRRYTMLSPFEESTGTHHMRKLARKDAIVRMSNIVPNNDDEPNNHATIVDDTGSIDESLASVPSMLHHSSKRLLCASKRLSSRPSFAQESDPGVEKPSPLKNVKFGNSTESFSKNDLANYRNTTGATVTPTPTGGALDNARAFLWDQDDPNGMGSPPSPPSRMPSFRSSRGSPQTSRLSFLGRKSISGRLIGLHAAEEDTEHHQDLEETATHDDEIPSPMENTDCIVKPEHGTFMKAVVGRIVNKFRINRAPRYARDPSTNEPNLALGQEDDLALAPQNNMQTVRRMDHRPTWTQSLRDVMRDPADIFDNMPESPSTRSRRHLHNEEGHGVIRKILHRHGKLFVVMSIVLALLIATMCILTPRLFGEQENGSSSSLGPMNIHQRDRYKAIRRTILHSNFTSEHTLDDPTSDQNHALLWLTDYDLNPISTDSDAILQRYALATFFFSTYVSSDANVRMKDVSTVPKLNNGTKRKNYLHPKDCWTTDCRKWKLEHVLNKLKMNSDNRKESEFSNSNLNPPTAPKEETDDSYDSYWSRSEYWMSEKGICMWHGVSCTLRIHQGQSSNQYNENSDIVSLALPNNNVVGSFPSEMAALENLERMDLQANFLSGTIPSTLGELLQLTSLDLSNNKLKGSIPMELHHCSELVKLQMGMNHLNGTIHSHLFYRMNKLKKLGLNTNSLEGRLPRFNDVQGTLESLYLEDNLFAGTIPKEYGDLLHLREMKLNRNYLKGKLPDGLSQLTHLELFHVDTNRLSSSIPHHYFDSKTNLREIALSNNNFEGPLPKSVEKLPNLKVLSLNKNGFTGTIPVGYGEIRSLEVLDLSNNGLTGPLPNTIPKMTKLECLRVAKNQISGTIPNAIKRLSSLKILSLKHNFMHGTIPSEVSGLGELEILHLEHNSFRGTLPDSICDPNKTDIQFISADCKEDGGKVEWSGHVICNCCDRCYN